MPTQSKIETFLSQPPQPVYATCPQGITWRWDIEKDRDGDGFYFTDHYAVARNGKVRPLNWSRFQNYYDPHFIYYVTKGFPAHQTAPPYHPCLPDCIEKMEGFADFIGSRPFIASRPSPYWPTKADLETAA